jgi:two-component system, LytTR family, response regulator
LKAVLIDDDERNLNALSEKLIKHCPQVTILEKCDTGDKGIKAIDEYKPDLVFLDIEMPVMNGFLMLQQLSYKNFELIFVTAYNHYAIQAIKYSALDYLVKPVEIEELKQAVSRAEKKRKEISANPQIELLLEHFHKKERQRLAIPTSEGMQFININDIIYLEASINYTNIYLIKQKFLVSKNLKEFEDLLPPNIFLRIHHSYIVNKNFVEKYIRGDGGQVVLQNGVSLDVSKRKKADFLQAIGY